MNDLPPHKKFERQIERIHQLLEGEEAIVTWDDHIPDPDNPSQLRQIDVTVRRDGFLTLVECRIHKEPQDVTWIEALMGRRESLNADAAIAVSASGFTKAARVKAESRGIHLRSLENLSPEEIQNWGRKRTVTLSFCECTQVLVTVSAGVPLGPDPPQLTNADGNSLDAGIWRGLLEALVRQLNDDQWTGAPDMVETIVGAPLLLNGNPPASVVLSAHVRRITQVVSLVAVLGYSDPIESETHAEVGRYELGETEMIEVQGNMDMTIDLSPVVVPENCCFERVSIDAGRTVAIRPRIIGAETVLNCRIPIEIRYVNPRTA